MKTTEATARVNGVHVMEAHIDIMSPIFVKMEATYALVRAEKKNPSDPESGLDVETHGKCTAYPNNWSEKTVRCLHELLDSMEEDLLPQHFEIDNDTKEAFDDATGTEHRGEEGPAQV